ncbi:hypothetical protein EYF80_028819 [Liparis tanakae]|uniref:Uncharacterized protein n=1 Tax=Liparis tanakae TaxID=230148 RepID=A0A4Z2H587_9TELE|nr:hypothetical protein EYF80_028819 [Liparis tanakae]
MPAPSWPSTEGKTPSGSDPLRVKKSNRAGEESGGECSRRTTSGEETRDHRDLNPSCVGVPWEENAISNPQSLKTQNQPILTLKELLALDCQQYGQYESSMASLTWSRVMHLAHGLTVILGVHEVGRPEHLGLLELIWIDVNGKDPLGSCGLAAHDRSQAHSSQTEHGTRGARFHLGTPQPRRQTLSRGAAGSILATAIWFTTVYSEKVNLDSDGDISCRRPTDLNKTMSPYCGKAMCCLPVTCMQFGLSFYKPFTRN